MFITISDLPKSMYGYQVTQITQGDDTIVLTATQAAIEELRSYLTGNNKKEWQDGRLKYDVDAILSTTGDERNPLLVKHAVTIAKWWIVELANADIIYEQAKERYDRTIDYLKQLSSGKINLSTLPQIVDNLEEDSDQTTPFTYGSRKKFTHE